MKKLTLIFTSLLLLVGLSFVVAQPAEAAFTVKCPPGYTPVLDNPEDPQNSDSHSCCPDSVQNKTPINCLYKKYLDPTIALLSAVVGVVVVIGITLGAVQYASSAGDPQKASAGKSKILKAMYGLIAFFFLYSALQFLSPGGIAPKNVGASANAKTCAQGNTFLTLKPWYAYLPPTAGKDENGKTLRTFGDYCQVQNFRVLPEKSGPSMIPSILLVIADDLLRIMGLIAVAYVIIGGIQYVTSQGEPDRTKHAQETVLNALIGLIVAIVAASFVAYIGTRIAS